MICYLVTGEHAYTMRVFQTDWAPPGTPETQIVSYGALATMSLLPPATYIFSDLERLSRPQLVWAATVASRLEAAGLRVLNHPARVLRRYDLLRLLHARGDNDFGIYRLSETPLPERFPVILRPERDHRAFDDLIETPDALRAARDRALAQGYSLDELLVVEFCDTSDEHGVFRKYGAFKIGDRIIPRHIYFGREWRLQTPLIANPDTRRQEWEYMTENPHGEWVRTIFRLAQVDYGRIDYSLRDGRPQVWEINTNPLTLSPKNVYGLNSLPLREHIARELASALGAIDTEVGSHAGFSVSIPGGREPP